MRPPGRAEPRKRRASRRRRRPVLTAILLVIGFLLSGATGAGAYFMPAFAAAFQESGQKVDVHTRATATPSPGGSTAPVAAAPSGNAFTVLLMGSDDDSKFKSTPLTQSMILVRIDPASGKVVMLSIPRDLWTPYYTASGAAAGIGKIDGAYARGQESEAIATVEDNFNVKVDDYMWVGLQGLIKLIDLVGGVDVVVTNPVLDDVYPADAESKNPYDTKRLAITPGVQHFDGLHALEYVRSRHSDLREDFGRSLRQQQVLVAIKAKAKNLSPGDIPSLVTSFQGELKTSINLGDVTRIRALLSLAAKVKTSNIQQVVMVGGYTSDFVTTDGQDALKPNWPMIQGLVRQYFPPT